MVKLLFFAKRKTVCQLHKVSFVACFHVPWNIINLCTKCCFNPLSSNTNILQILLSVLYIFRMVLVRTICLKNQGSSPSVIIFCILSTSIFDQVAILWGEISCWPIDNGACKVHLFLLELLFGAVRLFYLKRARERDSTPECKSNGSIQRSTLSWYSVYRVLCAMVLVLSL